MSTIDRVQTVATPPLVAGERLDRATFHERYEAMPPKTRAELIGGVVYMPSPLSLDHGDEDFLIAYWLGQYQRHTRGVAGSHNTSVFLGDDSETQPDLHLRIRTEYGGRTWRDGAYLAGPPELIVEISRSSRRIDLGPKKDDYERAGVAEYLVVGLDPDEVFWFVLREGSFEAIAPGVDGRYRSEVFPGLWLDPAALFAEDLDRLFAALDLGRATPEHAAFVDRLARAKAERGL